MFYETINKSSIFALFVVIHISNENKKTYLFIYVIVYTCNCKKIKSVICVVNVKISVNKVVLT